MINLSALVCRSSFAPKCISSENARRFILHNGRYVNNLSSSALTPAFARTFASSSPRQLPQKNRYWVYLGVGAFTGVCLQQALPKKKVSEEEDKNIKEWMAFNEKLQGQTKGKIPPPFEPVEKLALKYLKEPGTILDIGCETGKNSACLIKHGHRVVLLDIAPNAVRYTEENLKREGLDHGIQDSVVSKIEDLSLKHGPFKAVIGTYAFSFIQPQLFKEVMRENILNRVEPNGYFVGGFFGEQHAWAGDKSLSILNVEKLKSLFSSQGFSIVEISEQIEERPTVSNGITKFHTINVIAQRTLKGLPEPVS